MVSQPIASVAGAIEIVEFLSSPKAYRGRPRRVECIETHISWVFLTDRFAYKLKKPVRFEFLDFSSLTLREQACRDEVRLNRRLAGQVYVGVVPITRSGGRFELGGHGRAVDWVVKMQRLPAERSLDRLIQEHAASRQDIDRVARMLADFYQQLPPISLRCEQYRDEIARHVCGNEQELLEPTHGFDRAIVTSIHESQRRFLVLAAEVFDGRVVDGRIVEGHGDLRPEHIYLTPQPAVIDCIEFNADFRMLDVADELAFLAMECSKLKADWIGAQLLDFYRQQCRDQPPPSLIAFYKSYRACVRAKVAALRSEQLDEVARQAALAESHQYLQMAQHYAREIGPPLLVMVRGRSGTGKSTVAGDVAQRLGVSLLGTDSVRREILGRSTTAAPYGQGQYATEGRDLVYNHMLRQAGSLLGEQRCVVLDGTFERAKWQSQALEVADQFNAQVLVVHCHCPSDMARERIHSRGGGGTSLSDAREDIVEQQVEEMAAPMTTVPTLHLNTTEAPPALLEEVIERLKLMQY